jgi:hypothetical protein
VEEFCTLASFSSDPNSKVQLSGIYYFYETFWREWSHMMSEVSYDGEVKQAIAAVIRVMHRRGYA